MSARVEKRFAGGKHAEMQKQLILRVQPLDLADMLRQKLDTGDLDDLDFRAEQIPQSTAAGGTRPPANRYVFCMEGQKYPASLVNLPTVVETLKAYPDATYLKSADIGQMLVVYADVEARAADEQRAVSDAPEKTPWHTFYHSGLTPPTAAIVRRKFNKARRFGDTTSTKGSDGQPIAIPFPPTEVRQVEQELLEMLKSENDGGSGCTTFREVHEEVVEFEDWMVSAERPGGITINDATSMPLKELVKSHPRIVLTKAEWNAIGRTEPELVAACGGAATTSGGGGVRRALGDGSSGSGVGGGGNVIGGSSTHGGGGVPGVPRGRDEITSQLEQIKAQLSGVKEGEARLRERLEKQRDELRSELERLDHQLLFGGS